MVLWMVGLHLPFWQVFPCGHALPQTAQLALSVLRSTSQPLAGLPSQLSKPMRHPVSLHMLLTHCDWPLGKLHCGQVHAPLVHTRPIAHTLPHWPQCLASLLMFCSQPFCGAPSQLAQPLLHWPSAHMLLMQADCA